MRKIGQTNQPNTKEGGFQPANKPAGNPPSGGSSGQGGQGGQGGNQGGNTTKK